MDAARAKKWMQLFNEKIQSQKDYLSDLDTPIGDGDHGANMARGMVAAVESLAAKDFTSAAEVFQAVSMQLISKVGGASGPLYGSAFMGMAKAEKDGKGLSEVIQAGLDMIQKRGKAVPGEKTMVDVWSGIPVSLQSGDLTHEKIGSLVEATKDLKATKGRASYVGERSIGHIDPGSASSGLLFEALLETEAG
ncbi:dihydroxyacetone kinase subunit DhaL [Streptococcus sanguinis]|uniref:dihydroxyacetone kinase subunit DhaL n=1 Tax=Streptococcus sanguinis TaxID=1305 RepID=UPI001CAAA5A6|nr:dihydroxyacetone kinase subunit DhaL [Streptococcus sanguinis]MBF1707962.1 dihydroxyacetone kinase subunit L [Streptococcus sanguinis]MBZ2023980.1 dihydroxyacetone kinase subunit L [Streptococcus sanguinis]MBZ2048811.1 dihydroxyacetone kinase subunit L [Streptococcus sanguinis]MBZ2051176.1 dihydroxyacetone kinase subunit L [Streptococcus sanguinis]MBZ2060247.1 dihydroxyacetone kinase subunit L [Streptococcus sanguinis]